MDTTGTFCLMSLCFSQGTITDLHGALCCGVGCGASMLRGTVVPDMLQSM
jgi:hypothetical protein